MVLLRGGRHRRISAQVGFVLTETMERRPDIGFGGFDSALFHLTVHSSASIA